MKGALGIVMVLSCFIWPENSKAAQDPWQAPSICIEYFGEQASPTFPIVISSSDEGTDLGHQETIIDTRLLSAATYVVDPKVMEQLISEVEVTSTHEIEMRSPYVVFHVVVLWNADRQNRQIKILDGDQTFDLLERFKEIVGPSSLFEYLARIQKSKDIKR